MQSSIARARFRSTAPTHSAHPAPPTYLSLQDLPPDWLMFIRGGADTIVATNSSLQKDHDRTRGVTVALDNKERWVMRTMAIIIGMLMLGLSPVAGAASDSADTQKTDRSKGITVEDLGRGLKSAEQNIEKEIPKIGPAIIDTFKKITGKESEKQSSQSPEKQKK